MKITFIEKAYITKTHRGVSTFSSNAEYCSAQFCNNKPNTITLLP